MEVQHTFGFSLTKPTNQCVQPLVQSGVVVSRSPPGSAGHRAEGGRDTPRMGCQSIARHAKQNSSPRSTTQRALAKPAPPPHPSGFDLIFLKNYEINFHAIHLLDNEDGDECDGLVKCRDFEKMIQNRKLQFMCMDGGLLEYKYISTNEKSRVYCRFIIHFYNNMTSEVIPMGRPVILQFQDKDQMHSFTVCCCEQEAGVYVKQDFPVPSAIHDLQHDALFFLRDIQGLSGMRVLESAKWPNHFLGSSEGDDTDPQKVVLREYTNESIERLSLMLINPKDLGL